MKGWDVTVRVTKKPDDLGHGRLEQTSVLGVGKSLDWQSVPVSEEPRYKARLSFA